MKRALVSVSDKTGLVEFVQGLVNCGYEIISTGGTKKALEAAGIHPIGISDVTGFPEIMDGRVKTLHPKVHGALLCVRSNPDHVRQLQELGIEYIDLVCVNLYPFKETVLKPGVTHEEIIENMHTRFNKYYEELLKVRVELDKLYKIKQNARAQGAANIEEKVDKLIYDMKT